MTAVQRFRRHLPPPRAIPRGARLRRCLVWAVLLGPLAAAEAPARKVRFLPLGDSPPFRQEIRDGVRYELDAPPDSIPPREVTVTGGGESPARIDLRLGRISAPVKSPPGEMPLDLRPADMDPAARPWLRVNPPAEGDLLVLVWRAPKGKNWRQVTSISVPDGPAGAPAGTVRLINTFPQAVRLVWGRESIVLPAAKSIQRPAPPGAQIPFQVLVADSSGTPKRYYSGAVTQNPHERGIIAIYQADGANPRRPLKVAVLREPAPAPAPKP